MGLQARIISAFVFMGMIVLVVALVGVPLPNCYTTSVTLETMPFLAWLTNRYQCPGIATSLA